MRKFASHRGGKVDYLKLSPFDVDVGEAGAVEMMHFNGDSCTSALKDAKFTVPDFAIKSPWSDTGAAFSKLHVTDTKLSTF